MHTVNQLIEQAIRLPEDQRLALAHRLLAVDDSGQGKKVRKAWHAEILQRIDSYDRGETRSLPADAVFATLDQLLKE
jgi:hypothetical protein